MHFTTKTAEEYINKIKRGLPQNIPYNVTERILYFFQINCFTEEKLKMFEKAFNRTFEKFQNYLNKAFTNKVQILVGLFYLIFF